MRHFEIFSNTVQVYSISSATYNLILDLERTRLKKLFSCIIIYQTIDHILQETFLCVIPSYDYFLSTQNNSEKNIRRKKT